MSERPPQCGQTKVLMFSTMPSTGTLTRRNMAMPRRASMSARSCGVDTMTAPASGTCWAMVSWASPVPGGQWQGTVLVLASAFAFTTADLVTRVVEPDVWTMLFWRGLFGGLLIATYVVWRDGPLALAALRRIGRPGLVAAGRSAAGPIFLIQPPA